jgi:hypothetical protein
VDHEVGEVYDAISRITFSPDGETYAYKARLGDREFVVADGKPVAEYPALSPPIFNEPVTIEDRPSCGRGILNLAYVRSYDDRQWCVAWKNGLSRKYGAITGTPIIAHANGIVVFGGYRERGEYVGIGAQEIGPYNRVWSADRQDHYSVRWAPYIRPESNELVYAAREGRKLLLCRTNLSAAA